MPHNARVWNYFLGGKDNYAVDRAAGDEYRAIFSEIIDVARAFLARAVQYMVQEAGIRQFLDIGTGLPTLDNTHEVAQRLAPESRIVYVDNDPLVLVHARALLVGSPEGATDYIAADLREPEKVLQGAARTLDFTRPIAIMLLGILHFLLDDENPWAIVNRLLDAVPSGNHLALTPHHSGAWWHGQRRGPTVVERESDSPAHGTQLRTDHRLLRPTGAAGARRGPTRALAATGRQRRAGRGRGLLRRRA